MSGGMASGTARVRIKGKRGSVVRFLILSISYTLPWIIMLSQLAYYSKVHGPQVLLQLNIAYYLPSIPTLLLFGQVEKLLDAEFGHTASMAIRLMAGLAACAALAAYYPFMPTHLVHLLVLVVVLGAVSSVAFSTSYQLVAWFRSADTIALGIGCVASGPLALVIQIALQIGTKPTHWQWIALFEISAAMVVVGMLASASLMWQYWGILSGREHYDDGTRQPLLDSDMQEQRIEEEADQQAMMLSRMLTLQDPFQGFPFTTTPGMVMQHPSFTLRRAASDDITDRRRHARSDRVAAAAEAGTAGLKPSAASVAAAAAAAAAAAGRQYKHSQSYAPGRASAPLHAADSSLYDGTLNPAATAAAGMSMGPDVAGSSGSRSSGYLAAAAATARAASLHQYSGLPMVQPPGSTSATAAAAGAWRPDVEQHSSVAAAAGGNSSSTGTPLGVPQLGTPTPRDPAGWNAAVSSGVSAASVSANASPRGSDRAASPGPSSAAASSRLGAIRSAAVPAPAFAAAGSYLGELPQFVQQQQPLLTSVLGGSAPVFPLSASLLGEDDSSGDPVSPRGEDDSSGGYSDDSSSGLRNPGQQRAAMSHCDEAEGSPVSPSRLRHAILQHVSAQQQQQQQQHPQQHVAAEVHPGDPSSQALQQQQQQVTLTVVPTAAAAAAAAKKAGHQRTASVASAAATSVTAPGDSVLGDNESTVEGKEAAESLADVFVEVLQGTWMVVLAALISSTIINCIFPFFTYVESSGLLGEFLPQVLFYTRMLSDIVGRLLPRRKALAITNPAALLALAGVLLLTSGAFFVYLQVPPRMQHDPYVLVLILVLWLVGGYINTMSYILAPSLVAPRVCTKASAVMALTYQIAHILGLVIATGLAIALYGDIAGEL